MSNKLDFPHLYKKGKIVKIKTLDDNNEKKEFIFSTEKNGGVQSIIKQCNNINQIIAKTLLKTSKIGHYFGISKDKFTDISKNKIPFNQFKSDLTHIVKKDSEKLFEIIEKQNKLNIKLTQSLDKHSILLENSLKNNRFVEEVAKTANIECVLKETNLKIISIQEQLKQLIG